MAAASIPVDIRGRYLWRGDERFLVRGVVYQVYNSNAAKDEIADDRLEQLEHDIGLFKELGVNAIFVYTVDHTKCHDRAMKMLEEAGIYVLATISSRIRAIDRLHPVESYNEDLMSHFFKTADVLAAYPNSLGIIPGITIINDVGTIHAAPVIRAVVRDLKRYLTLKHEVTGQRVLPVGYDAADVRSIERPTREYLAAGAEGSRIDFWAKNDYSWCSPANMQISGYNNQVESYSSFNIPAFFSEYGANTNHPRDFGETAAMLSPAMTHIFSGGLAYELWAGGNGYGLVRRVTGKEASKWRRAHDRFETVSAEGINREMQRLTLADYANDEEKGGRDRGRSRRLDRNVVEYRETSIGAIVLYKDFINLRGRLAAMRDVPAHTDPEWVDTGVTAARAPEFPARSPCWTIDGEGVVPSTCVDWQTLEEGVRDEEYVVVSGGGGGDEA